MSCMKTVTHKNKFFCSKKKKDNNLVFLNPQKIQQEQRFYSNFIAIKIILLFQSFQLLVVICYMFHKLDLKICKNKKHFIGITRNKQDESMIKRLH